MHRDDWLAPLGSGGVDDGNRQLNTTGMVHRTAPNEADPPPLLPSMSVERYLNLLD